MALEPGAVFRHAKVVAPGESAAALGSGGLEVFSTPSLVALLEVTAKSGVDPLLPPGHSTVGTEVHVRHLKATPIGATVRCEAVLEAVEGRRLRFRAELHDEEGLIGTGTHTRVVVEEAAFLARLAGRG